VLVVACHVGIVPRRGAGFAGNLAVKVNQSSGYNAAMHEESEPRLFRFVYRLVAAIILAALACVFIDEKTHNGLPRLVHQALPIILAFGPLAFLSLAWLRAAAGWMRKLDALIYTLLFLGVLIAMFSFLPMD
jgi:hypothetical protein